MNQLDALKQFTTVVVDSADIESIQKYHPEDVTTNPSIILKATTLKNYQHLIDEAIKYAKKLGGNKHTQLINASDKITINFGVEILKKIPGRISTEIDSRLSFNQEMCIDKAKKFIRLYEEQGIQKTRILIKLASTWEGIRAAEELEKNLINCNLTLIFSFAQARACADAGVFLISPFVGRIYDWYETNNKLNFNSIDEDPGVKFIRNIFKYYKKHGYKTIIMGASFRNTNQIVALAGCDRLTITPEFLEKLIKCNDPIKKKLLQIPIQNFHQDPPLSKEEFHWKHNQNLMAVEKLSDGIRKFSFDQENLEKLLLSRM